MASRCFSRFLALTISALIAFSAIADTSRRRAEITDSLRQMLATAPSAADSLRLLYNIFDLSPYDRRMQNARELLAAAKAAGDIPAQIDAITNMANIASTTNDVDIIDDILQQVYLLPPSIERDIAETFVLTSRSAAYKYRNEQERADHIHTLLVQMADEERHDKPVSPGQRIADLFTITYAITGITQGQLLNDCFDRLDRAIAKLPADKSMMLRSRLYTTEAIAYGRNENPQKAIAADRRLLAITDRLQDNYSKQGRPYRDFPTVRYVIYRRMLKNFDALTLEETDIIKSKLDSICAINEDCAHTDSLTPLPRMAWLIKHGRYEQAIPLLQRLNARAKDIYDKRYYLRLLKQAAKETGNDTLRLNTAAEYNDILEEYSALKSEERMRELKMIFDYQEEKRLYTENELSLHRTLSTIALCTAIVLALLLILLIVAIRRIARDRRQIAAKNDDLRRERESLRKAQAALTEALGKTRRAEADKSQLVNYITNEVMNPIAPIVEYSQMIIDNAQGENKRYLDRFKSIVNVNVKLLQSLVADVQELAVAEDAALPVNKVPTDLNALGQLALDSILPQVNTDLICVQFIPDPQPRAIADIDPRRVEIVLLNLLSNAAKFTRQGSITLRLNLTGDHATFTVTDTGCGIPADKADDIFKRFEKLNPDTEGAGLGLSVCAIVAKAIDSQVYLDTAYPGPGAQFIFTINTKR